MQWTEEQRRAIEARGANILLSAAAGSGKTTVLVERVLGLIASGTDVDRMLIVTFTRAASADMRAKLSRELGARAAEGDERCRGQQLLLDRASISTLHGFCADFLRAHFANADVDPAFRVLDDAEVRRLRDEALDAAVEEVYAASEAARASGANTDEPAAAGGASDVARDSDTSATDDAVHGDASKAARTSGANAGGSSTPGGARDVALTTGANTSGVSTENASGSAKAAPASNAIRIPAANADGSAKAAPASNAIRSASINAVGGEGVDAAGDTIRAAFVESSDTTRAASAKADGGARANHASDITLSAPANASDGVKPGATSAKSGGAGVDSLSSPNLSFWGSDLATSLSALDFARGPKEVRGMAEEPANAGDGVKPDATSVKSRPASAKSGGESADSFSIPSSAPSPASASDPASPSSPNLSFWGADIASSLSALDYARGPKGVRAMAEALLGYLEERPDPEAWLARACAPDDAMRDAWLNELALAARREIERALLLTRQAAADPECNNYFPALEKDIEALAGMAKLTDFDELRRALEEFRQASPPRARKGEPGASDEVKKLRTDAKKALDGITLPKLDLGTALADIEKLKPELRVLGRIARRAREIFEARKAELAGLSYTDLEHRTLRALADPAVAAELRERYEYIFVDEYQDTSDVQEALISRIARGDNLFMVGDVKQSIYRFRQAEPKLFLDKYARYGGGEGGLLLPLTMNFRSRPAILNFVNRVFERCMVGGDSEIFYDELARLNHGNAELEGGNVELHLLVAPDESADEELQELAVCEREALFIAGRIRELMAEDSSLRYRDFAILTRNKRGVLGKMATVLLQQGIPAFADGSEAFYDSVEILLALSLLKLTANRRSDVELIGVLRSPAVGLTLEDLASIRAALPVGPFVDACAAYAQREDEAARKLREFFDRLERWRLLSLCVDLGALTRTILDESGLYDCMGALPGGPQRQANLDRLADSAAQFDRNVSGSLTRFLKHTEKLQARGDGDEAHLLGEGDDVVRLMTAHKSKGLEFPVVFGAMLSHRYNRRASAAALSAHRDLGLGCLYCDPDLQTRRKTLPQLAILERARREDAAEELRVLYVLLTRARDRLVLVGSVKDADAAWTKWNAMRETPSAANCYLDVILPALERDGGGLCDIDVRTASLAPSAQPAPVEMAEPAPNPDLVRAILWNYPDPVDVHKPLKLTVTDLLNELEARDALPRLASYPSFVTGPEPESAAELRGAQLGTAYHRAIELLDLPALRELSGRALASELKSQLDGFLASGLLLEAQRRSIRDGVIARFLEGELGQRMLRAREVRREWAFNAYLPVSNLLSLEEPGSFGDGELLIQGVIDCAFREGDHWVMLDYKTDRGDLDDAQAQRYGRQVILYAAALERITRQPVANVYLCLLSSGSFREIARPGTAK